MSVDADGRVLSFQEKPERPDPIPGRPTRAWPPWGSTSSTGTSCSNRSSRTPTPAAPVHDFGKDIIPAVIDKYRVLAFPFRHARTGAQLYWRDVGTVDAFWEANLELIGVTPPLDLYDKQWPVWTYQEQLPPAKFVFDDDDRRGMAVDSMVSGGCVISGAVVRHSLLFSNVRVNSYATVAGLRDPSGRGDWPSLHHP